MVGLPEISALKRTVTIRETEVEYSGITLESLATLMDRFPQIKKAFAGMKADDINATSVLKMAPSIVGAIIVAGLTEKGNPKKEEERAMQLTLGEQMILVSAIIKATFPQGVGPFVEQLEAFGLGDLRRLGASGTASAGKSQSQPNGSSKADTPPEAVWRYTPRQLHGWLELVEREGARKKADAIEVAALANLSGTKKGNTLIDRTVKKMRENF